MLFNSLHFLFFLPIFVGLYYVLPNKLRWILIFIASCYFYMAFIPKYILILFLIIIIDYAAGIFIENTKKKTKLAYLIISLLANILLLCFFKYFNFFNKNLVSFFDLFGKEFQLFHLDIILPIGLSFHTFQSMSYTIEVYRGNQKAERHLGYFANYVLFFPQMVAGPIERYSNLGNQLKEVRIPLYENFVSGFRLILFGLFLKMVIADNIAPFINQIYDDPLKHSSIEVLASVFLFSFQIYADFFGYSTIALGSAKLLGITIMDNFNTPYLSKSVSEFWTRWHISLSSWFRDYLYIPLGGNRVKLPKWSVNILIVFMLSGLWHGPSWCFVFWGALHGFFLLIERYFSIAFNFKIKDKWSFFNFLLVLKTFIITSFIWIFFRAESFDKAKQMLTAIFKNINFFTGYVNLLMPALFCCTIILYDFIFYNSRFDKRLNSIKLAYRWTIYACLLFLLLAFSGTQKFMFIYFQF